MFIQISKDKLKKMRGDRTRQEIADGMNCKVTQQDIYSWETGWQPSKKRFAEVVPALAKSLGCSIDDITEQIDLSVAV